MEPIEAEAMPMSLRGTKVFKTSGESKGLESGVEPKAALTRNLEENKKSEFIQHYLKTGLTLHTFVSAKDSAKLL